MRRSPDPLLQAVRTNVLTKLESHQNQGTQFIDLSTLAAGNLGDPPRETLRLRIARQNQRTLETRGFDEFERRLGAILEDRERTYIGLGVLDPAPPRLRPRHEPEQP